MEKNERPGAEKDAKRAVKMGAIEFFKEEAGEEVGEEAGVAAEDPSIQLDGNRLAGMGVAVSQAKDGGAGKGSAVVDRMNGRPLALASGQLRKHYRRVVVSMVELQEEVDYAEAHRPKTRADCESGIRPCPFVLCRHHLYLDVHEETGSLKLNFPELEVDEMPMTCALDVAEEFDGCVLEEIGVLLNVTRERARQLEIVALEKLRLLFEDPRRRRPDGSYEPLSDEEAGAIKKGAKVAIELVLEGSAGGGNGDGGTGGGNGGSVCGGGEQDFDLDFEFDRED